MSDKGSAHATCANCKEMQQRYYLYRCPNCSKIICISCSNKNARCPQCNKPMSGAEPMDR